MKRKVILSLFLAGGIASGVSAVSISKDAGYVNTLVLESFSASTAPAANYNNSYFDSATGGLATYKYLATGTPEGYVSFDTPDFDPAEYSHIRSRFYVDRTGGNDVVQVYGSPYGGSTLISKSVAAGTTPKEYRFDFSSAPIDGSKIRIDPWNYANDGVEDSFGIDYWLVDRGLTKGLEWDRDGDDQRVGSANVSVTVNNGILSGTGSGDAQLNLINDMGLSAGDADLYKYVEIKMKNNGDKIDLFWSTTANGIQQVIVEDVAGGDTDWHTYIIDMTDEAGWTGTLDYLRLDPVNTVGAAFEVDSVRVMAIPEPATLGMIVFLGSAMVFVRRFFLV